MLQLLLFLYTGGYLKLLNKVYHTYENLLIIIIFFD